jgi:hypothetical protein
VIPENADSGIIQFCPKCHSRLLNDECPRRENCSQLIGYKSNDPGPDIIQLCEIDGKKVY